MQQEGEIEKELMKLSERRCDEIKKKNILIVIQHLRSLGFFLYLKK